ncbi:MAG TPA: GMC family oxidoreductase [Polyangium sp.]|nr:GMC family oxidoreductase [Polyangium sp.]
MEYTDVAIVGSGPLGAAAARRLVAAGTRVTLLEAGKRPDSNRFAKLERAVRREIPWAFPPWRYETIGDDVDLNTFALRMLGGSSLAWGAVTPRFLENDFRLRSRYGVGCDWPIGYDELEPYYFEAEQFMGVAGSQDAPWWPRRSAPYPMPAFPMTKTDQFVKQGCDKLGIPLVSVPVARNSVDYQGRPKCTHYAVCRACPIGAMYASDMTIAMLEKSPQFALKVGADVVRVEKDASGRARRVVWQDEHDCEHAVEAERIILAVQGIETVRLLLDSGLAGEMEWLGRGLMEHPKFYMMGRVAPVLDAHRFGFETATTLVYHDHCRRGQYAGGRLLVREAAGPSPSDIARTSGLWGKALADEIREIFGHYVTLGAFMEQLPYDENRVTLSRTMKNERDRPAAKIDFRLMHEYETNGYLAMKRQMERIMDALDATDVRVIMEPTVAGHYMGTHRMGNDPRSSVTNDRLECHAVKNLFLASAGAFPSGGISNPTLTGVALTIRMADHILGRI